MRIYFFHSVHEPLFEKVAQHLCESHGVTAAGGFVFGEDQALRLREGGFPWYRLDVLTRWMHDAPREIDLEYLAKAERAYGYPNLATMIYGDRHVLAEPYEDLMRRVQTILQSAERIFRDDPPDAFVIESIGDLASYLMFAVAKAHGVRCLLVDASRVPGRSIVYENPYQRWERLEEAFASIRARHLTSKERAGAAAFLERYRSKRPTFYRMGPEFLPTLTWGDARRFLHWVRRRRVDPGNVTLRPASAMVRQRLERMIRYRVSRLKRYFDEPVAGEKYFVFPLAFQPESTTLVCAPCYVDQVAFVEDVARALPVGYRLYVKEHFGSIGRRPLAHYDRIKSLWNVRLIAPEADSFKLVLGSAGVITATSTMGWEAVLLGRPAVTFGETFYNAFPLVHNGGLRPRAQMAHVLREVLDGHHHDEELLLKFVAAILSVTADLTILWDNPTTALRPGVLSEENVGNISTLLMRAIAEPPTSPAA